MVQKEAIPIGDLMSAIRNACNPILGKPKYKQTQGRVTFYYQFISEIPPVIPMKLKIEINTREHFQVYGAEEKKYTVESRWFTGNALINTYYIEELLATKLRALYQRKKGRDLFDIWYAIKRLKPDTDKLVFAFKNYMKHQNVSISSTEFILNVQEKIVMPEFINDTKIILNPTIQYSPLEAFEAVKKELLEKL